MQSMHARADQSTVITIMIISTDNIRSTDSILVRTADGGMDGLTWKTYGSK